MKRKHVWAALLSVMAVAAALASCGGGATPTTTATAPATTPPSSTPSVPTTTAAAKPQYGGSIALVLTTEPVFNLLSLGKARPHLLSHNLVWDGDWAKGPAGGYGSKEVPWTESTNLPSFFVGQAAEKVVWKVNNEAKTVDTVMTVRQGIHFALDSTSEASRLVNGREMTADDVAYSLNQAMNNPAAMDYQLFPEIRGKQAVKTGPWEVTVTHTLDQHLASIKNLLGTTVIVAKEVLDKYGSAFNSPKNDVGTGPYIITDYVSASMASLKKNPNYYLKDPVGPGKGSQLPYIDSVKYFIIVDASTREAALRTAKLDQLGGFIPEDANSMKKQVPDLAMAPASTWSITPMNVRTDLSPFNDVKVRRALMMATDLNTINKTLYGGLGQILSWPTWDTAAYHDLYLGLNDPEMPSTVKELYTYSPDKAKQLLKDAGYPTGFKTSVTTTNPNVDYYSIVKDQWSKVGVDLSIDVVESVSLTTIAANRSYKAFITSGYAPPSTYPEQANYYGITNWTNGSMVDDPYVNGEVVKSRIAAITDFKAAMKITKNLMKYVLDQAYAIPTPRYPQYVMWWPWIKNYSGELSVGYFPGDSWVQYVWVDQPLKKSMGH